MPRPSRPGRTPRSRGVDDLSERLEWVRNRHGKIQPAPASDEAWSLRAMLDGLAAVVWEADAETVRAGSSAGGSSACSGSRPGGMARHVLAYAASLEGRDVP